MTREPTIFVDADACPVKQEVYRVAERYSLQVKLVANAPMQIPEKDWLKLVVVGDRYDEADDWIVEHIAVNDIVITGDIRLAARCLEKDALVLGLSGRPFTPDNIGSAMATRELFAHLRDTGEIAPGPKPFAKRARSLFLQQLDEMINRRHSATLQRRNSNAGDVAKLQNDDF